MQPERDHNVQGENSAAVEALGRVAPRVGRRWFEMKTDSAQTSELACT
jgi:hypothetical protein